MQVILQEKIKNLGNIGDVVVVKPGYARNCLLRQGKALRATKQNMEAVDARRGELEKLDQDRKRSAQQRAELLDELQRASNERAALDAKVAQLSRQLSQHGAPDGAAVDGHPQA